MKARTGNGWTLWLSWVLATAAGLAVGGSLGTLIAWFLEGQGQGQGQMLRRIVFGSINGATIGTAQWLVLRRQIDEPGWWVLSCTLSWALGLSIVGRLNDDMVWPLGSVIGWSIAGAIIGILGWLGLQQKVSKAGWWIPANVVSWPVSWAVAQIGSGTIGVAVMGAVGGAVTGIVLVAILHPSALGRSSRV